MKHFLIAVGILSIVLAAVGCKKASAPQQGPLPVNVVIAVEKEATNQAAAAATGGAEAAKNAAALNLEFTQVKSPIDGRVSDARITLGNLVQPGPGPESVLTTVVSVDPIYSRVDADENAVLK